MSKILSKFSNIIVVIPDEAAEGDVTVPDGWIHSTVRRCWVHPDYWYSDKCNIRYDKRMF